MRGIARAPMIPADLAARHGPRGTIEPSGRGRVRLSASVLDPRPHRLVGVVTVEHGEEGDVALRDGSDPGVLDDALAVPPFRWVIRRQLAAAAALVALPIVRLRHAADPLTRLERARVNLDTALELCRSSQ
ncbi:MAG: hypothetical protein R2695_10855 [Acidimicrobiales bacterium]